ncbi:SLBB domain-containing protein [Roseivirga thermotolerans]|uniref:Capsule polysaccharide transporter n=1 Tax=Roseivirga thermotolerans TaxID=1758176 RepID=A0ABQ3I3V7_9BACT|nr:SLBB domain-containing protein [Roseivirga thermotolerans]GHE53545.1 capsule polysaccharide transporter [Roseivirga thermotolerans]
MRYILLTVLLVLILGAQPDVQAQGLAGTDLTTINVDDLSDSQIQAYIKQAQSSGYTEQQLEALARQRGMPESEIAKLRRRVESLRSGGLQSTTKGDSRIGGRQGIIVDETEVFGKLPNSENSKTLTETQRKIFGFDLFQTDNLTFAPNLNIPTPEDYVIGPGDEIIIDLWGASQLYLTLNVTPEGFIRPENLGPIYINGLTVIDARKRITERLSQIYRGLVLPPDDPGKIFSQISVGNVRTINVTIVGEVRTPGNYVLNSLSTVYTALHAVGGPTEQGTFRNIQLIRNGQLLSTIDVYEFLNTGIQKGNQRLRNGDVIIVKPYQKRVELEGEVKRPGLFELKANETFENVLEYAGGFKNTAYTSLITARRNGEKEREVVDINQSEFSTFEPKDGDVFQVTPILDRYKNRVQIEGAVYREGEYELTEGLTLMQLIEKADGLRGDAFLNRATIYRTNEDFSQDAFPFDLGALMSGEIPDIDLQREDLVRISSIYDLKEEYYVQISGEVAEGGVYQYFNTMTIQDLIVLAGGLTEGASGSIIEISRRNKDANLNTQAEIINVQIDKSLALNQEDRTLVLQPFDQVYIRKSPGYNVQQQVTIEGEVVAPGIYSIARKDERISDIIERAHGLTQYAYPKGAILVRKTEFSSSKSSDQISQEYLQQLRSKLLSGDSELKNISQQRLIERLNKIENRSNISSETDAVGSRIKKDLIEDVSKQDSLVKDITIKNEEPVALDLDQILANKGSKYDFIVRPGDVISIPGRLETVRVAGEVTSPLNLRYDDSYSFKDYIYQSGGFQVSAKRGRSYVQYPNGERKGVKRFLIFKFYPKIEPGTTIFVARKAEKRSTSLQEVLAITSSLATIVFLVQQIRSN